MPALNCYAGSVADRAVHSLDAGLPTLPRNRPIFMVIDTMVAG
jgi:hypothetical protein